MWKGKRIEKVSEVFKYLGYIIKKNGGMTDKLEG